MKEKRTEDASAFYELEWDTAFFGVICAKAVLYKPLTSKDWNELKARFDDYQFISIENRDAEPVNSQMIGRDTTAFLADVNIQFAKKIERPQEMPENITVHQALKKNVQILEIAKFQFSKFTEDTQLANRGGVQIYSQWILNSFEKPEKFFALSKDESGNLNGYVLYSYSDNACVIELIAVSQTVTKGGIGTRLFKAVEYAAHQYGTNNIQVGTQVRNIEAINFYHSVGCKQVGCHQVYHLWNLQLEL